MNKTDAGIIGGVLEKRAAKAAQRQSILGYQDLVNGLPDLVWLTDLKGVFTFVSPAAKPMLGFEPEDLIGAARAKILTEESDRALAALLDGYMSNPLGHLDVLRSLTHLRKDGTQFFGEIHVIDMRDPSGAVAGFQGITRDITERRRSVDALRQSEQRVKTILDSMHTALVIIDEETHEIVDLNPAAAEMIGVPKEEVVGRRCHGFICPAEAGKCPVADLGQVVYNSEQILSRADGAGVPILKTVTRATLSGRRCLLDSFVDITERKRAEEALRENEEKFRAVYEGSNDAIMLLDEKGFFGCNPRTLKMFGFRNTEEFTCVHPADISPPTQPNGQASFQAAQEHIEAAYRQGHNHYEWTHSRVNGESFPAEVLLSAFDYGGKKVLQATVRDITERKRKEEERARLVMAMEHAAEAIVITDVKGTIEYVNPAFEHITGYTREEAIGKNPRILKSGKQDEAFYENLWNTLVHGGVWSGRFTNMKKDGSLYEEEATISPVLDDAGQIVSFVAIKRDISDRLMLERRLRQAEKMEAIGTLAGGIAHDFNNVLASVLGYAELAVSKLPKNSMTHKYIDQVISSAGRAKDLVRQILAFSRQVDEERKPVKTSLIVREVLHLLRPLLPATIEIRTHVDEDCRPILADPSQVHQVLMNLCTNAYHAMKHNGGVLTVSLTPFPVGADFLRSHPDLREGLYVRLSVSDTGCGMDKQTLERIFDPFFTTKAQDEGTGLGLATVHSIVSSHGGIITVYSEPGKGSTFHVYMPCTEAAIAETLLPRESIRGGHENILVLDDEEPIAHLMEKALKGFGYNVIAMTDAVDALAAFRAHPGFFDLIITDHMMPNVTGEQMVREVLGIRPNIGIILTTGFADGRLQDTLKKTGVSAMVMKPASIYEMARVVRRVLDGHSFKGKTIQDPASV